jgi:serine/threonine protein phosphatase PrpC
MERIAVIVAATALLLTMVWYFVREISRARLVAPVVPEPARIHSQPVVSIVRQLTPTPPTARAESDVEDELTAFAMLPSLSPANEGEDDSGSVTHAVARFAPYADVEEPSCAGRMFLLHSGAQTDAGKRRGPNEDAYVAYSKHQLYAVADGMGGIAGGALASALTVRELAKIFDEESMAQVTDLRKPMPTLPGRAHKLVSAIEAINRTVCRTAATPEGSSGMGSTIVAAQFLERRRRVFIAHVGDSRCYRLRRGVVTLLTRDHTLGERGVTGASAAYLRRVLGGRPKVYVDVFCDIPNDGDRYLLCSDGLSKVLDEAAIARIVALADAAGARDNVTALVVQVRLTRGEALVDFGPEPGAQDPELGGAAADLAA